MRLEDLKVHDRITVRSPEGNTACGRVSRVLASGNVEFFACKLPVVDYVTPDNIHLVERVEDCERCE